MIGLLLGSPLSQAQGSPAGGVANTSLPVASDVLGKNLVASDQAFDEFVLSRLRTNAEYQLLDNQVRQAQIKIEQEDAANSLQITGGIKHRPVGEQNNTVSDVGGYLSIQKTLYDWGRVDNRVTSAEQELEARVFENAGRRNELSEVLAERYFNVLKADLDLSHMRAQLSDLQHILLSMTERAEGGSASSLEHEIMADELLSLEMEISARQLERQKFIEAFENHYGSMPLKWVLPRTALPEPLTGNLWDAELVRRSPALQALRTQVEAARSMKDARFADYFPTLKISASYIEVDLQYKWYTTLDMSYEVYNGGKAGLGVAEQELKVTEIMLQLQTQYQKSRDQMQALLTEYDIQQRRYRIYDRIATSKRQLYRTMTERMRSTQGNLREIYNAQKAAIDATLKRNHAYLDAVYQAYKARLLLGN